MMDQGQVLKYYSEGGDIQRGNEFSAGIDLPFYDPEIFALTLQPGKRKMIKTGVYVEIPYGWVGFLDTRSSSAKVGLDLLCRTIDCDYRGNIRLMLHNDSDEPVTIIQGQFIAQMLLLPVGMMPLLRVDNVNDLSPTERGADGFGSTGRNFE